MASGGETLAYRRVEGKAGLDWGGYVGMTGEVVVVRVVVKGILTWSEGSLHESWKKLT